MKRIFHRVVRMIAWNISDMAILLTEKDFKEAVSRFLQDLDPKETVLFKLTLSSNTAFMKTDRYQEVESLLNQRMANAFTKGDFFSDYHLFGEDAHDYFEDFLQGYRFNYKHINYTVGYLHDGSDKLFNISLRKKQNLWQKMANKYGDIQGELNIPLSQVSELHGSSLKFLFVAGSKSYYLSKDGVRVATSCP